MKDDERFERRLRETLNRQAVDPATRDALRTARLAALDGRRPWAGRRWVPATALAALLLIVGLWLYPDVTEQALPGAPVDDLVVITDEDELELYQDLEFYIWLEQERPV